MPLIKVLQMKWLWLGHVARIDEERKLYSCQRGTDKEGDMNNILRDCNRTMGKLDRELMETIEEDFYNLMLRSRRYNNIYFY